MKDFNRVAIMSDLDTVNKGFMFEFIQENFPGIAWQPVGYAVMAAFEKTYGGMNALTGTVRDHREKFIAAVGDELKTRLGDLADHSDCVALTNKIRSVLQPSGCCCMNSNPTKASLNHAELGL